MERIDEIIHRMDEIDKKLTLLLATKGKSKTDRNNTPIPDKEMTEFRGRIIAMLNRSGKRIRNLTYGELDKINYLREVRGNKQFKDEFLAIEAMFKAHWGNPDPNKTRVIEDLPTLLNNWSRYVDKSQQKAAKRPVKAPVKLEVIPEPNWDWKAYVEKQYGPDNRTWDEIPQWFKEELVKERK